MIDTSHNNTKVIIITRGLIGKTAEVYKALEDSYALGITLSLSELYELFPDTKPNTIRAYRTRWMNDKFKDEYDCDDEAHTNKSNIHNKGKELASYRELKLPTAKTIIENNEFSAMYSKIPEKLTKELIEQHLLKVIAIPLNDKERNSRVKELELMLKTYALLNGENDNEETESIQAFVDSLKSDQGFE